MNVEQELKRIKYKDNWTFESIQHFPKEGERRFVRWGEPDAIEWTMTVRVKDICNPGRMTTINTTTLIPFYDWRDRTPEDLFHFCLSLIKGLEEHEAEEWFKIDGSAFVDAHRDDALDMRGRE